MFSGLKTRYVKVLAQSIGLVETMMITTEVTDDIYWVTFMCQILF
jgi:hypothetical protein